MQRNHPPLIRRRAMSADLPDLIDLQERSMRGLGTAYYDADLLELALRTVTLISGDLIDEGHYHVWTDPEGAIRASGGWARGAPGYAVAMGDGHGTAMVRGTAIARSVFVDPVLARQGIGRMIMRFVEQDAARHGVTRLTLTATLSGVPLYRHLGYVDLGPSKAVLPDGRIVWLREMEKRICRRRGRAA